MPFFKELNTLFIHIPKTAGISVNKYLEYKSVIAKYKKFDPLYLSIIKTKLPKHISYYHHTYNDIKDIYSNFDKKFTIIRNPYDRMISEYFFRMSTCEWKKNENKTHSEDLADFIPWFLNNEKNFDNHKLPQYQFIQGIEDKITILRFENLKEDFKNYFNEELNVNFKYGNYTRSKYQDYYTPQTKELVYNYYQQDFIQFNYNKEF